MCAYRNRLIPFSIFKSAMAEEVNAVLSKLVFWTTKKRYLHIFDRHLIPTSEVRSKHGHLMKWFPIKGCDD